MSATAVRCEVLEWDSSFFGKRIARIHPGRLGAEDVEQVETWLRENEIDCAYWLADADDDTGVRLAQEAGFRFVDVRVTLGTPVSGRRPPAIGAFREGDLPELARIARESHHQSRFYADPGFPVERCHDLYETWIEKSCGGWARTVLVPRVDDRPMGYLSCHVGPDGVGQIGIVAVSAAGRGKGLGGALVDGSLDWFSQAGCAHVTVVTQGRNVGALRLYERAGFRVESVQLWLHAWPTPHDRANGSSA